MTVAQEQDQDTQEVNFSLFQSDNTKHARTFYFFLSFKTGLSRLECILHASPIIRKPANLISASPVHSV